MRELLIDGTRVADDTECYVIAEVGHNHQGDLERCKELFKAAKACGANAVKLQKRDNRTLFTREMFDAPYNSENAYGPTYGLHREALEFEKNQYEELIEFCKELEITFFATAFDIPSFDFLADLQMPAIKIASADITYTELLADVASYGRPVIVSTGGASINDIRKAHDVLDGCPHAFLQCTAAYPAAFEDLDLRVIETYRALLPETVIGLSDHDKGIAMAPVAYGLGARIVEKHFTLDRTWKGTDQAFSLEPVGLRKMIRDLQRTRLALGEGRKRLHASEMAPLQKMKKKLIDGEWKVDGKPITYGDATGHGSFNRASLRAFSGSRKRGSAGVGD
jgi:sialic acid synthase